MTMTTITVIEPAEAGHGPHLELGRSRRTRLAAATALAPMAWGTTYLVTTQLLPPGRPLLAGCLRALPAGLALAALTRVRPKGFWWAKAAVLGVLNIGGFFALLFTAAYRLPGGVAASLGAVQPLLAAGLAALLLNEPFRRTTAIAGGLGIVGVTLLVLRSGARLDPVGIVAAIAAAASMASGVVLTKKWGRPVSLLAFTSWQLIAGGLFLMPLVVAFEGLPTSLTLANVAGYSWLASVGGAVAYALWFRGIEALPVAQVSILGLLSPVVAALAGWIALNQSLNTPQLIGMTAILTSVWLVQRRTHTIANNSVSTRPLQGTSTTGSNRKAWHALVTTERSDLLFTLAERRGFLRQTVKDLTDEQAALAPTASELCLGGIIKHVANTEAAWVAFITGGATAMGVEAAGQGNREDSFRMMPGETLDNILDRYAQVAERSESVVAQLDDLDASHPLPDEPWFPPNTSWSARRVLTHLIGETAHHSGHADILRESIDGAKTMG